MKLKFSMGQIMAFILIEKDFVHGSLPYGIKDNWLIFVDKQNLKQLNKCTFREFDYLHMIPQADGKHTIIDDLRTWKCKLKLIIL